MTDDSNVVALRSHVGAGIESAAPEHLPVQTIPVDEAPETRGSDALATLRAEMRAEMAAAVADVEFRLAQVYEMQAREEGRGLDRVYVEDIHDMTHRITGYVLTSNSPAAGSIAWSSLHVVYMGVDYTIADGNTALKYAYFVKPGSGTTASLQFSATLPTLGANDALIFVNNGGVATSVLETSIPAAVGANSVSSAAIQDGAVTSAKTDFYTNLVNSITAAQNKADLAQATADGSITTYFQAAAPWANGDATAGGATNPSTKVGDIWYDSDDGQAYRWSGASGSPANTWIAISDSDIGAALSAANNAQAKADIKTTTYYSALASPPVAPVAPAGNGFTVGDFWVVTDQGNLIKRWSGSAWVDLQVGDAAISGVSGTKVGSGISGTNITTGTVAAARVGSGVNGAVLSTATGTVGTTQIATGAVGATQLATNAVTPPKINAAFHLLY